MGLNKTECIVPSVKPLGYFQFGPEYDEMAFKQNPARGKRVRWIDKHRGQLSGSARIADSDPPWNTQMVCQRIPICEYRSAEPVDQEWTRSR
jgi:hypothetical protein